MIKNQRYFKQLVDQSTNVLTIDNANICLGQPVYLLMNNGDIIRTSPVVNYKINNYGRIQIETQNTIYIKL